MIPYGKQNINDEDIDAVAQALGGNYLTCGPAITAFEQKLCEITGARHAVACANGTAALHLACMALDLGSRDLGITSPITFLASANCFEFCGARSDFVDIDPKTLCLSPGALEEYCARKEAPRAVVAVDFAGVCADLPALRALSKRHGFALIEDAAHSLGSTYAHEGKQYHAAGCAHVDLAILSFHPVKTVTTGEGGAVLTNDDATATKLRRFRAHGMVREASEMSRCDGPWYYEMQMLGYNYRITDLQCALGLSQLKRLESFKARRQSIVRKYQAAFGGDKKLLLPPWPEGSSPCFHLFPLQFAEGAARRAAVYDALAKQEIQTQVHYIPVHWQPYYAKKYGFEKGKCPAAEKYYDGCLSLPLFPAMSDSDVERVIAAVRAALGARL
jgi:UDP-4-amino-4,6-dideoxy-N-acetyl-beta-L-altrosamine transaminase